MNILTLHKNKKNLQISDLQVFDSF